MSLHRKVGFFVMILGLLVFSTAMTGCNSREHSSEAGVLRLNMHTEPPSLDPAQMRDSISGMMGHALYEGLTVLDAEGKVQPGVAKRWDVSGDGLRYTFYLRDDAKWSNGDAVTAYDFEYAWKRVLDPQAVPPSPYAYQLYYLKNAVNYHMSSEHPEPVKNPDEIGVKAIDAVTLEVELSSKTPYFLSLTSFYTFFPVHREISEADPAFAAEADTLVTNGPFRMNHWEHFDTMSLVQNEHYWNKDQVHLEEVRISMVDNPGTALSMYKTGELDYVGEPLGEIHSDEYAFLEKEQPDEFQIRGIASTYYYVFNSTAAPFDQVKIREAFSMAIDRQLLIDSITKGGELAAYGFVPPGISGAETTFREEYKDEYFAEGTAEAKRLLEEGMAEGGYSELPVITLTYHALDGNKRIAEAVAGMWREQLDVEVKLEAQEWGVFLTNRQSLNYQVASGGWSPDYNDPMTYLDIFTSTSGTNDSGWSSEVYDQLVAKAYTSDDAKARMEAMAEAERLLVEQERVVMPIYYYTSASMIKPYVKDLFLDYKGDLFFNHARVE